MKRIVFALLLVLFLGSLGYAQIVVDKGIYKASFSNTYRESLYVSYFLYKGGGSCSRAGLRFKNDEPNLLCATDDDYKGSHYDKGHLANAEDFAFDCEKDELTFRYYNCLPQTPNLNRGVWKINETQIRQWSQGEKLYIICGGFFGTKKIGKIAVPTYCWKVVQSVATKKILFCGWFSNTEQATLEELNIKELENKIHSKILVLN